MVKTNSLQFRNKIIVCLVAIFIVGLFSALGGLYFNLGSDSLPIGVYRRINKRAEIGDIAASCLTNQIAQYGLDRGYLKKGSCPEGITPVIKEIIVLDNGYIEKIVDVLYINGNTMIEYPIWDEDSNGRSLKVFYNILSDFYFHFLVCTVDSSDGYPVYDSASKQIKCFC